MLRQALREQRDFVKIGNCFMFPLQVGLGKKESYLWLLMQKIRISALKGLAQDSGVYKH